MANHAKMVDVGLSPREVSMLAEVSLPTVKKALQHHKLQVRRTGGRVLCEPRAVFAMAAYARLDARLSAGAQQRLRDELFAHSDVLPESIEISDVLVLRVTDEMRRAHVRAIEYIAARSAHIECRVEVLGGAPVVAGTRLSVHALAARIEGGEDWAALEQDYPDVSPDAFRVAVDVARSHPPVGRPRKPWRASVA
jgi:uncharacterized protein (DUF433 family)